MVMPTHNQRKAYCRTSRFVVSWLAAGLIAAVVIGCGGPARPAVPFGKVKGRVTWYGRPLANAHVVFEPETGRPSYGLTSESGEYELLYKEQPWGAIVGRHRVRITTGRVELNGGGSTADEKNEIIVAEILPEKFNVASTLAATVAEGNNTINFDLNPE
jgi:hypothetical protein